MAYRKDWGQPQIGAQGDARMVKTIGRTVAISVADNVTGNTVGAFMIPAGFVVTGLIAVGTDMDSGTAMLLNIGDAGNASRYFSGLNTQAAVTTQTIAAAGLLFKNAVDTECLITIGTQAGTPVAGTVDLRLVGYLDL